jgi:hypothetical protein
MYGLRGFLENSWEEFVEPTGLLSLLVEVLFVALAACLFGSLIRNRSACNAILRGKSGKPSTTFWRAVGNRIVNSVRRHPADLV